MAKILRQPDVKSWLIRKDPHTGKDWRQEEKGTTDGITGWHYWLDGHEFEQAPGVSDGQGSLACCGPWGWTWLSDCTNLIQTYRLASASQAPITQCHILSDLTVEIYFLLALEAGSPRSRYQQGWVLLRTILLACRWSHMTEKGSSVASFFCYYKIFILNF